MSATERLLGREELRALLIELGRRCAAKGLEVEMYIVGGAAMTLAHGRSRMTRDIDAVFEPKMGVYEEARLMAADLDLPPNWLNDGMKGLLPDVPDPGSTLVLVSEGISVSVASPEYLFAMKAAAARLERDAPDLLAPTKGRPGLPGR